MFYYFLLDNKYVFVADHALPSWNMVEPSYNVLCCGTLIMYFVGFRLISTVSVFTALHVMQTRYCDEISVRPSVRLSVCHTRELWQNGRKICPDLYTIRKNIYPSFLRR